MSDLIRRLQRLNYSIHSNGYKDSAIFEAIDAIQQAHREGWEQCQRECVDKILDSAMPYISIQPSFTYRGIANMIAAMEYKEKAND